MARNKAKSKAKSKVKPKVKAKPKAKAKAKPKAPVKAKAKPKAKAATAKARPVQPKKTGDLSAFVTPLDDRVLVMVETFTKTEGGLFIPATVSDRPSRGKVVAVGRGHRDKKGRLKPMDVRRGDEVLFAPFSGTQLNVMDQDLLILREAEILGIVD